MLCRLPWLLGPKGPRQDYCRKLAQCDKIPRYVVCFRANKKQDTLYTAVHCQIATHTHHACQVSIASGSLPWHNFSYYEEGSEGCILHYIMLYLHLCVNLKFLIANQACMTKAISEMRIGLVLYIDQNIIRSVC